MRRTCLLVSLVLATTLARAQAHSSAPAPAPAAAPGTVTLVVVGTTDVHGHIEPVKERLELGGKTFEAERGGAALLGGYLGNLRARHPGRVLLIDSGDMMQGTPVSNLGEGAVMMRVMNALGYAAAAVGNHEFDFGPVGPPSIPRAPGDDPRGVIKARMGEARFPWLAANIADERGQPFAPGIRPFTIVEVAGIRVGIVGGTTEDTPRTTLSQNLVGLRVEPLAPAIQRAAAAARAAGATVVVAAVHAGGACKRFDDPGDLSTCESHAEVLALARALAQAEDGARVDAIFGGHTHQGMAVMVDGIPVVQAFDYGRAFARVDLTVDRKSGRVVPGGIKVHPPIDLCAAVADAPSGAVTTCVPRRAQGTRLVPARYEDREVKPDPRIEKVMAADLARVRELKARPVGIRLEKPLMAHYQYESTLGHLVADILRAETGADFGLINGGGLRAPLPAGELTYGALFESLPFDNRLAVLRLTGAEIRRWLERNLGSKSGILIVSGMRLEAECQGGKLVVKLTREDDPRAVLEDDRIYRVGTIDFLARGGDDFGAQASARPDLVSIDDAGPVLRDVVASVLGKRGGTLSPDEPRLAMPRMSFPGPRPVHCPAP